MDRWDVSDESGLRRALAESLDDVYRYAARLAGTDRQLAEDLVQDAAVQLIHAARSGRLTDVGMGWFCTVVRHRFIDHLRATSRLDVGLPADDVADDADDAVGTTDSSATWITGRLSPIERFVLVSHHVDGFGVLDVARMIGRSEHATESLLSVARRHARHIITSGGHRDRP